MLEVQQQHLGAPCQAGIRIEVCQQPVWLLSSFCALLQLCGLGPRGPCFSGQLKSGYLTFPDQPPMGTCKTLICSLQNKAGVGISFSDKSK